MEGRTQRNSGKKKEEVLFARIHEEKMDVTMGLEGIANRVADGARWSG